MSMFGCGECGAFVDTDDDPECIVEVGNMRRLHKTVIRCESCREREEIQQNIQDGLAAMCEQEADRG